MDYLKCDCEQAHLVDQTQHKVKQEIFAKIYSKSVFVSKLYPALVEPSTLSAKWIDPTASTKGYMSLSFTWDQLLQDDELYFIPKADITGDIRNAKGLVDVNLTNKTIPTTTVLQFDAETIFGTAVKGGRAWIGAPEAAFEIFNVTQSTLIPEAAVTVVELSDGRYQLTYAAQASGDVLIPRSSRSGSPETFDVSGYQIVEEAFTPIP